MRTGGGGVLVAPCETNGAESGSIRHADCEGVFGGPGRWVLHVMIRILLLFVYSLGPVVGGR